MLGESANECQLWKRYKPIAYLGKGEYGRVTKAVVIKTRRIVAIKETNSDQDGILQTTLRELGIMARLKHRNVVQ
jgi:serine/threonine protein kinase